MDDKRDDRCYLSSMPGTVFAIGGNERKQSWRADVLRAFVEHAGGSRANIAVITAASVEPVRRGATYERLFRRLGAGSIDVIHPWTTDAAARIAAANTIFVTGGDQERLMLALRASAGDEAIRRAVAGGATYGGTSAGAAAVSATMIAGSTITSAGEELSFGEGLGLVPHAVIDQHFSERNRLARLQAAVTEHELLGIGIDENTAAIFRGDGSMDVIGTGSVTIVKHELLYTEVFEHAPGPRLSIR
jgi:cyanophycinase